MNIPPMIKYEHSIDDKIWMFHWWNMNVPSMVNMNIPSIIKYEYSIDDKIWIFPSIKYPYIPSMEYPYLSLMKYPYLSSMEFPYLSSMKCPIISTFIIDDISIFSIFIINGISTFIIDGIYIFSILSSLNFLYFLVIGTKPSIRIILWTFSWVVKIAKLPWSLLSKWPWQTEKTTLKTNILKKSYCRKMLYKKSSYLNCYLCYDLLIRLNQNQITFDPE